MIDDQLLGIVTSLEVIYKLHGKVNSKVCGMVYSEAEVRATAHGACELVLAAGSSN